MTTAVANLATEVPAPFILSANKPPASCSGMESPGRLATYAMAPCVFVERNAAFIALRGDHPSVRQLLRDRPPPAVEAELLRRVGGRIPGFTSERSAEAQQNAAGDTQLAHSECDD